MGFLSSNLALSHRFGVYFLETGFVPSVLDFRFQRVSGMQAEIETETIYEGGQNLYQHRLPKRVSYSNLVLQRGIVTSLSPLSLTVSMALSSFSFNPSNVLVILFNEKGEHVMHKLFLKAVPVKWSISDMDAESEKVMVESIELSYTRFTSLPLPFPFMPPIVPEINI
jgi:phage tail-like protein